MSEAKFTPGPWVIGHQKGEFDDQYWIGPEPHFTIAFVKHGADDEEYGGEEAELGNARLIAAAPELYEMLKYAIDFVLPALRGPIDEALAKAEGRALTESV